MYVRPHDEGSITPPYLSIFQLYTCVVDEDIKLQREVSSLLDQSIRTLPIPPVEAGVEAGALEVVVEEDVGE